MQQPSTEALKNIHRNVLRVLGEVGVQFEHPALLDALAGVGAEIDRTTQTARFPAAAVDAFLAACPRVDWETRRQRLLVRASVYAGKHLDPHTNQYGPLTPQAIERYLRLAHALPHINATFITGCPWGPNSELEPLYERFYCWKFGAEPSGILYPQPAAPQLLELYQAYAQLKGRPVKEVFQGGVFMQSPLRLSAEEAAQFVWWWSRGFRVGIAHMTTAGLTAPVTPAGVVVVHLAEAIALGFLHRACYGETALNLLAMLAPVDMRSTTRPYGRPEMATANLLFARMARFYGAGCFLHSGLADANLPSNESGAQKAVCTLSALLAGADAMIDAGSLAMCDGHSPIQMILDDELAGVLQSFLRPYDCSDAAIGFDSIAEAGPGGLFIAQEHTVERYREELWEPAQWNRIPLEAWLAGPRKLDADLARDRYDTIMAQQPPLNFLNETEEQTLLNIIVGR